MGKTYEKMEFPSKKIASTFWWDTFAILFLVGLVVSIGWGLFVANMNMNFAIGFASFIYEHELLINIISLVLSAALTFGALLIAIKKIRKRAIVKKEQVNEIAIKCLIKWIIYFAIVVAYYLLFSKLTLWIVLGQVLETAIGTLFGRYLISKEAV